MDDTWSDSICFLFLLFLQLTHFYIGCHFTSAIQLYRRGEFDTSYVGFMKDGAQWLVDNTDIKFVGIDYLSVAAYDDLIPSHRVFLKSKEIILVEGLKLDDINPGAYSLYCLPLRLLGAEGSPIRCILMD